MPAESVRPRAASTLTVREFQQLIRAIYFDKDQSRGRDGTFRWLVEETGELARGLRKGDRHNLEEEFGDVFAWLASLASLEGIDLAEAAQKYAEGCPRCGSIPCSCREQPARRNSPGRRTPDK